MDIINTSTNKRPLLSVVIKAYNEENKIEQSIRSALTAIEGMDAEVILADSLSTDNTIAIASQFPVKVVQLTNTADRGCGTGAQLGYQFSRGEFIYLMDGDMELTADFLREALSCMQQEPNLGGVGGVVSEVNVRNLTFKARQMKPSKHMRPGETDRLNMGGLYRRNAIEDVGYFSNRNLHSFEEYELGLRLRQKGWRMKRLPIVSVSHYGHTEATIKLLAKRWRSRYSFGVGELLRSALGRPYFLSVVREFRALFLVLLLWIWLIVGLLLLPLAPFLFIAVMAVAVALPALLALRKRNLSLGVYSFVAMNVLTAGMLVGFFSKQSSPEEPLSAIKLHSPQLTEELVSAKEKLRA